MTRILVTPAHFTPPVFRSKQMDDGSHVVIVEMVPRSIDLAFGPRKVRGKP